MEEIYQYLSDIPQNRWYWYLLLLLYITALGIIPSNSDLTMWVYASLAGMGKLNPVYMYGIHFLGIVLADHTSFIMGKYLGQRIFKFKKVQKLFPYEQQKKILYIMHQYPLKFLILLRLTTISRPIWIIFLGSLGFSLSMFSRIYSLVILVHISIIFILGYFIGQMVMDVGKDYKNIILASVVILLVFFYYRLGKFVLKELNQSSRN
jgi:membrane protein DedA with SNARE-associated domain